MDDPRETINALYIPYKDSITLIAGILQRPYFHSENPEYVNYAGIRTVAGFEFGVRFLFFSFFPFFFSDSSIVSSHFFYAWKKKHNMHSTIEDADTTSSVMKQTYVNHDPPFSSLTLFNQSQYAYPASYSLIRLYRCVLARCLGFILVIDKRCLKGV